MNMKTVTSTIQKVELVRMERKYEFGTKSNLYFYFLWIEGLSEPLLLEELKEPIEPTLVGTKFKYKLDVNGNLQHFEILS